MNNQAKSADNTSLLNQYFTPRWVAEAIVEHYFGELQRGATVVEPSCGDGRFLMALPDGVNGIGVELDPAQAALARLRTHHQVITGDFMQVALPTEVDAVIGNPPFVAGTVSSFLDRSHTLLREGGRCGFILPSYILQTSSKVMEFGKKWSIQTEMMPRNIFPGLSLPITFTVFTKERTRRMHGFFLYREAQDVSQATPAMKTLLAKSAEKGSVWRQAVNMAFVSLGTGEARLQDLYAAVTHRPAENQHCEQQIRKVLQTYPEFEPVERGVWRRHSVEHELMAA